MFVHDPVSGALPGALPLTRLRTRARAARRAALIVLIGAVALLATAQTFAERSPTGQEAGCVAALAVFFTALPALAATQVLWWSRARAARECARGMFAPETPAPAPLRLLVRLGVAAGWAVTVLLGLALPRLFAESGLYGTAGLLDRAAGPLGLAGYAAGVFFALWWARDVAGMLACAVHRRGSPGDPWDPERGPRPRRGTALWAGAVAGTAALLGARAHLWEPGLPALSAVFFGVALALVARMLVTDE
ncbi:hypothetical protein Misp01_28410 [Microtetraspora sp. NBRC 13810]|uniref:hypothetical protein n=1 Tax=Microtetraspora sp. NBRC 13810 TaxID=3030990 RepID=UPI0024A455F6|nr:hypothetical protein [Microtetraspora sp. NBRC 13810]GLW07711.1 hypothetical protein Misp01_28410 [Microtetraspora sp. NBRC 13810]